MNSRQQNQGMGKYSDGKDGETGGSYPLVAVCIDRDKNSQNAIKYAAETLARKGHTIVLVHVNTKGTSGGVLDVAGYKQPKDPQMKDLFLPFRCFCAQKKINCKDVVLDDHDVAKSIVEFAARAAIEKLVVGATASCGFLRFKAGVSSTISKTAPDFCAVHVVTSTKGGKVASVRQATRQAPAVSPLRTMIQSPKPDHAPVQKWTPPPPPSGLLVALPACTEEMEAQMKRLLLELKQTMDMHCTACKEARSARSRRRRSCS